MTALPGAGRRRRAIPVHPAATFVALLAASALLFAGPAEDPVAPVSVPGMTPEDHVNLERNLRWMLARERAAAKAAATSASRPARKVPVVALYADAGAWHDGLRGLATLLEAEGVEVRALDRTRLTSSDLAAVAALILPGGWAPFERDAAGAEGLQAIRAFVEQGGRCLGICAGAYLMSKDVRWEGADIPYPLGLFDGRAEGPVPGLAPWPERAAVRLKVTPAGVKRSLAEAGATDVLYYGGGSFHGGTATETLALYPDGSPAIVERRVGKGAVVLCAVHFECAAPPHTAPSPAAGRLVRALLGL